MTSYTIILETVINAIDRLKESKQPLLVAVDGDCCSGKTTLAKDLVAHYQCNIIHIDDFYLPLSMRSKERFEQPGRNIHWERLLKDVFIPLKNDEYVSYAKFLPETKKFSEPVVLEKNPITIVEGTYCLLPELRPYYDLILNLKLEKTTQYERIAQRETEEKVNEFKNIWIPKSEVYFDLYQTKKLADYTFDTSEINMKEGRYNEHY